MRGSTAHHPTGSRSRDGDEPARPVGLGVAAFRLLVQRRRAPRPGTSGRLSRPQLVALALTRRRRAARSEERSQVVTGRLIGGHDHDRDLVGKSCGPHHRRRRPLADVDDESRRHQTTVALPLPHGMSGYRTRPFLALPAAPAPPATSKVSLPGGLVSSPGVCSILARRKRRREQRDGHGGACGGGRRRRSEGDRHLPARPLRVGLSRDRRDAGRGRRRQGRAPGGALADRRHPRAAWLLRDDGRLPADRGGSAVDRRSARSAVAPEPGRPGGDPHAQRGDPPDPRRDRHPRRSGGGDHPRARPSRRARRLRRPIERDGRGLADGLLRRPARHVPEHRGAGRDPPARQPDAGPRCSPSEP